DQRRSNPAVLGWCEGPGCRAPAVGTEEEHRDVSDETLSNLLHENRRFEPPADLAANANVKADAYDEADADPVAFWEKAADRLSWDTKWDQVLDWDDAPFAKWFVGGKINAAYNCVDRHVEAGNGDRVPYHWVGEPEDDTRDITYAELK